VNLAIYYMTQNHKHFKSTTKHLQLSVDIVSIDTVVLV
jgi:hypothetical protein